MKGVMFVEKGKAAIIAEDMPVCKPDTMLCKVLYSGVSNGTERSFLMDGNYGAGWPFPKRIAYQHVSEVIEVGSQIACFQVGDVVFSATYPGHVEYHLLKESDLVIKLPQGFDLEQVVRLAHRGDIKLRPLVRDVVALDDAVRIYDTLRDAPSQLLGTVFVVGAERGWEV